MTANIQEVDPLVSKFLFDYVRYAIDKNDFELFKKSLNNTSLLNISNPRFIQNEIHSALYKEIKPPLFLYDRNTFQKILKEINCFEFLLKYCTVKDFSSVRVLEGAYRMHELNLEKYIDKITKSEELIKELEKIYGTDRGGVLKMVESTINSINVVESSDFFGVNKRLDLLFISLKLHFTFYQLGAFIIFTGKQKQINSGQYLKELWTHTCPDDACAIIGNESPVIFDPLWLTYLHFYGGQNIEYWTKTTLGFSLGFDDYHGAENYLYQYYLLTITRCIDRGNTSLSLPSPKELDNLKTNEPYKFMELYEFTELFKRESVFLISHCESLVRDARQWDLLFNNHAEESLTKTKEWIEENVLDCEKLTGELKKRMTADDEKIRYFSQKVLEEYRNTSVVGELAILKKSDQESDSKLKFNSIFQHTGNLDKRWFFKDDDSHPDHIFAEFARNISRGERKYILESIKKLDFIEIIPIREIHIDAVYNKIKDLVSQMILSGFNPSVIFLPLELTKSFAIKHLGNFDALKFDDGNTLKIVNSNDRWKFDEIVILDKSAGVWTYKPVNSSEERLSVEIIPNDDELYMKILVKTTINYTIVNPEAIKILKFDLSVGSPKS